MLFRNFSGGSRIMRSKRIPDRVHVVRPPQQDEYSRDNHDVEIVRMLAQISDKLKRSEAERYQLLNELREYRKSLTELEDKADSTEKAFLTIENKMQNKGTLESEIFQRQARLEKHFKETEEKLVKSVAGQAVINQRLKATEDKQTAIDQRLDESVAEQARLDRQLELTVQDKSRLNRKMERLEEVIAETQDALRAKAMVLLTDQSPAVQAATAALPPSTKWSEEKAAHSLSEDIDDDMPWWRRSGSLQAVGIASMVVAALLGGWMINQVQQPKMPEITVLENGELADVSEKDSLWNNITSSNSENNTPAVANDIPPSSQISDLARLGDRKLTDRLKEAETYCDTSGRTNA